MVARVIVGALLLAFGIEAQNPLAATDPFAGKFRNDKLTLELSGGRGTYTGTLNFQGSAFPVAVRSSGSTASGTFQVGNQQYTFTLAPAGQGLRLTSDGAEYVLEREGSTAPAVNPIGGPAPSTGAPGSIVGYWRNDKGYAKLNADGTGEIDGQQGRYTIQGNNITLSGAQGSITLQFQISGDVLTVTGPGGSISLNRTVEPPPGVASVRPELVGKWCWVSVVTAQGGGRNSNRCYTLNQNGTYQYYGEAVSTNPYGGAASQTEASGMWTATDNTLVLTGRGGRQTVLRLEKRNHPKNRDPMIVLDGQTFVTFYNKPPW